MAISPRLFGTDQSSPSQWTFCGVSQSDNEVSPFMKKESSGSDSAGNSPVITLSPSRVKGCLSSSTSSQEVDFFQSPQLSPTCSPTLTKPLTRTPEKVTQAKKVFEELEELDYEPMPEQRKAIQAGMEALKNVSTDSPNYKTRSSNARQWFSNLFKRASKKTETGSPLDLVSTHDKIVQMMDSVSLYRDVVTDLRGVDANCKHTATHLPACFQPVNYKHIVAPVISDIEKKALGFHFCPPDHPLSSTLTNIVCSVSGVYCASFKTKQSQPEKRSTFFPMSYKTTPELDRLIQESSIVCERANRALRSHSNGIWIETLHKNGYINSAYPLFYVDSFRPDANYRIVLREESMPNEKIYKAARKLLKQYAKDNHEMQNPIRYVVKSEGQTNLFIDVASSLNYGVSQGIVFRFDKNLFNNIARIDEIIDEI